MKSIKYEKVVERYKHIENLNATLNMNHIISNTPCYSIAPMVKASLEAASVVIDQAVQSAEQVLKETRSLQETVNQLTVKYNFIMSVGGNASSVLTTVSNNGEYLFLAW